MGDASFPHHAESQGRIEAAPKRVFEHLDDHRRMSAHMTRRTWMMAGSRMDLRLDERMGRAVGSHIRLEGRVLGVRLEVEEVVVEREPPRRKVWATVRQPRLVVIGPYRMGFELQPLEDQPRPRTQLRVFLDYALPAGALALVLGPRLGHAYARWCTRRMVADAVRAFAG
jgi:hypothetical protein